MATVTYTVSNSASKETHETADPKEAARKFLDTPAEHRPAIVRSVVRDDGQESASIAASTWYDAKGNQTNFHKSWGPTNGDPDLNKALDEEREARRQRGLATAQEFQELADRIAPKTEQAKSGAEQAPANTPALDDPEWKRQVAALRETSDAIRAADPNAGKLTLDDAEVSKVGFSKRNDKGVMRYDLDVSQQRTDGAGATVRTLNNLDRDQLVDAVGEKNADTIDARKGDKGVLKGKELAADYGLSPEESERRAQAKEERKAADAEAMRAKYGENSIERDDGLGRDEILARAAANRARDREALDRDRLGKNAESKRIDIENLSEKAQEQDDANRLAANTGRQPNFDAQKETEREKNHKAELLEKVHRDYRVAGSSFYFKDRPEKLAFKDKGEKLVTSANDERVAFAMATMAEARGWKTIKVNGHPDFRREVWMEASLRGIQVKGFAPQERDLKELEERRERTMRNSVEKEDAGRKVGTAQDKPAPEKTDRQKVAEAVAATVMSEKLKGQDPAVQQQVMQRIQQGLDARAQAGKVPPIPVYDKNAPSQAKEAERIRPQVERNSERTR